MSSHIVFQLLQLGYKVRGTVRNPANDASWSQLKTFVNILYPGDAVEQHIEMVRGDLLNDDQAHWNTIVEGVDYVIHTASPFRITMSEKELVDTACRGTELVLKAVGTNGQNVKKVVLTSSVASVMVGHPLEKQNAGPMGSETWSNEPETHGYELSKLKAERMAWDLSKQNGFKLDTVCPGLIMGPGTAEPHTKCQSSDSLWAITENTMMFGADLGIAVCDVRDVAELHIRCAVGNRKAETGMRYIVACDDACDFTMMKCAAISNTMLRGNSGYKPATKELPTFLVKALSFVVPDLKGSVAWIGNKSVVSNAEAKKDTGIVFRPVGPSVEDHVKFMFQFGKDPKGYPQENIDDCILYPGVPLTKISAVANFQKTQA